MPPSSPGVTVLRQELDGTRSGESRHLQEWLSCIIFDDQIRLFEKPPFALNGIEWIQKWEQWTVRMWTERMRICHSKKNIVLFIRDSCVYRLFLFFIYVFDKNLIKIISFQEFLETMHQFANQGEEEKLSFLFKVEIPSSLLSFLGYPNRRYPIDTL